MKIASDTSGSGNTANIGSIISIDDIKQGLGVFSKLGEEVFDDYWKNYKQIILPDKLNKKGKPVYIASLPAFLEYRGKDEEYIRTMAVAKKTSAKVG
jgi:hypothetical protein